MRGGRYWEGEEGRKCRMCGWGRRRGNTCGRCVRIGGRRGGWQEVVREVLSDEGGGEGWTEESGRVEGARGSGGVEE